MNTPTTYSRTYDSRRSLRSGRKGVEMSMNVIVIAVIVLLILVVLILIFTGVIGNFNRGLTDCAQQAGSTQVNCKQGCGAGYIHYSLGDKNGMCCCTPNVATSATP